MEYAGRVDYRVFYIAGIAIFGLGLLSLLIDVPTNVTIISTYIGLALFFVGAYKHLQPRLKSEETRSTVFV